MIDLAALPPELNSTFIYTGPGAAPMMAAAGAWGSLGAELHTAAATYTSVVTGLTTEAWLGAASASMATAITPHLAWLSTTAAAADRAASQAAASAAAYEEAFAMTVPPPVVFANRVQLATLVATNILGQNTPAIAANEAHYAAMWAQDAAAMLTYAATSSVAGLLNPLAPPVSPVNPAGLAGQAAVTSSSGAQAGLSQLVATLPTVTQGLAQPLAGSSSGLGLGSILTDAINSTGGSGLWNTLQGLTAAGANVVAWHLFAAISGGVGLSNAVGPAAATVGATGATGAGGMILADSETAAPGLAAPQVAAELGEAYTVDGLSVPPSWSATVPAEDVGAVTLASAQAPAAVRGFGGIPLANYGLAAAAAAPLAFRGRSGGATPAPSKSLLARSRARKRRPRAVPIQAESDLKADPKSD